MILVDTSAWVEFDRATDSPVDRRLTELIATEQDIAVTEPVIMEVVAGARDARREAALRRLLGSFRLLRFDAAADFDAAAAIHAACRRVGVTPRGMIDCMIASVAHRNTATLLACDADLERVAHVMGVPLDRVSSPDSRSAG